MTSETEGAKRDSQVAIAAAVRTIETLEAVIRQADMRLDDLKREAYEFKRDVVVSGENPRNGTSMLSFCLLMFTLLLVFEFTTVVSTTDYIFSNYSSSCRLS